MNLKLRELCERLPYGVWCKIEGVPREMKLIRIMVDQVDGILLDFPGNLQVYLSEVKLCLRPLSGMTREEKEELEKTNDPQDFYNSHNLDYRDLKGKGYAE